MKVSDSKASQSVSSASRKPTSSGSHAATVTSFAPAADTSSILGIPDTELTPKVRAAIMTLMSEVDRLRRELEQSHRRFQELERDANADPLVPVLNRRAFVREMSRIVSFASRYDMPASLVYFDINGFKNINDRFGHAAGDAALIHIGGLLTTHTRESDVVGRLGGDEFGVVLANAPRDVAQRKAKSLADLITQSPASWNGDKVSLTAAYGIYTFQPGEDAANAMEHADRDMFLRKRTMKDGGAR